VQRVAQQGRVCRRLFESVDSTHVLKDVFVNFCFNASVEVCKLLLKLK